MTEDGVVHILTPTSQLDNDHVAIVDLHTPFTPTNAFDYSIVDNIDTASNARESEIYSQVARCRRRKSAYYIST